MTQMSVMRQNSLEPVCMPNWRWAPFLNHAIDSIKSLEPEPYPIPKEYLQRHALTGSKARPLQVMTSTWGCKTTKLRQVRAACVEASAAASVLNFVINPQHDFDLPFFGADLVTLPSGHLLALDLQPVLKEDPAHTRHVWDRLIPLYEKWKAKLPDGGPIPEEAQPYFSPGFLWTRLPLDSTSDELINAVIMPAFCDYLYLYLELVKTADSVMPDRAEQLLAGQRRYTDYRAEKDPARGMLTRFYGSEWTEAYIHNVLFDL